MSFIGEAAALAGASASTAATISSVGSAVAGAASALGSVAGIAASLGSAGLQMAGAQRQRQVAQLQVQQLTGQAAQADFAARQEELRGQQTANELRRTLMATLAAQNARYAGAGLTLEGTPETVADETTRLAERELGLTTSNATITAEQNRTQANLLRQNAAMTDSGADLADTAGMIGAGVNLLDGIDRWQSRLPGTTTGGRRRVSPDDFSGASLNQGNF